MFEQIKDIISKAETKSDVAVVLIAGTAGYVLDAQLNILGMIEPGVVGPLFATGALGAKKLVEDKFENFFERNKTIRKANNLIRIIKNKDDKRSAELINQINEKIELYRAELIDKKAFDKFLNSMLKKIERLN